MKSILEILEEYALLEYRKSPIQKMDRLNDYIIGDNLVARVYGGRLTLTNIRNGTSLVFPESLYSFLQGFYNSRKPEVLSINRIKRGDNISKFIIFAFRLLYTIEKGVELQEDDLIVRLCEAGSKDFVEHCIKNLNIQCSQMSYTTVDNIVRI